ncbi:hypothetical protein ACN4EG_11205 [Alkalinema pantanalense CENA528]
MILGQGMEVLESPSIAGLPIAGLLFCHSLQSWPAIMGSHDRR